MLTAQWTRKLPIIQSTAPAELAARLIHTFLDDLPDIDSEQYFVIDFCSGAGGKKFFLSLAEICNELDSGDELHDLCPSAGKAPSNSQAETYIMYGNRQASVRNYCLFPTITALIKVTSRSNTTH